MAAGRPWVRLLSCNPAEVKDPLVAPFSSGYPAADRSAMARLPGGGPAGPTPTCGPTSTPSAATRGAGGLAWGDHGPDFMHESPYLNLYSYPAEADYARANALGPTWHQLGLDGPRRRRDLGAAGALWRGGEGALIYLSLGSLGSADVGLMQRLVDLLGRTDHRVIVSKGPLADQIRLHDNMTGEGFLPQPAILPMVDLVITHGGNNTVVECFHHGKPMVVLPLFWDQVDNAQRVDETGFGRRLATYEFEDAELTGAIDALLADVPLRARMAGIAARMQASPGTTRAADLIERVAVTGAPVTR